MAKISFKTLKNKAQKDINLAKDLKGKKKLKGYKVKSLIELP